MNKLDEHKQLILDLRAQNESVRAIAAKISEHSGEKVAPSTVQWAIKQWSNGNGESKADRSIDASVLQGRVDSLEILVGELESKLEETKTLFSGHIDGLHSEVKKISNTIGQMDPDHALVYQPWGHGYVLGGFKYATNGKTYPVVYESVWALVKHKLIRLVR